MSIPKDVQEAMAYAAEIFDDCDNGEWATIRTHIAAQDAEIDRLRKDAERYRWIRINVAAPNRSTTLDLIVDESMRSANATDAQTEVK